MSKTASLCILLLHISFFSFSQKFHIDNSIPVSAYGRTLQMPWAGGINFPYWSEIDLNQDGKMDLFMFDRSYNRVITLINDGTSGTKSFHYAPEYTKIFPELNGWAFLYDYNCDGLPDLFTVTPVCSCGIMQYKSSYNAITGWSFTLVDSTMLAATAGGSKGNIFASVFNTPRLDDIDGDGDMDVISVASICSGTFAYYRNKSMEDYGVCDSLNDYVYETDSWGHFQICSSKPVYGSSCNCGINCQPPISFNKCDELIKPYELGNQSDAAPKDDTYSELLTLDLDGDGDKDLLAGDGGTIDVLRLYNVGSKADAIMECATEDTLFPSYDTAAILHSTTMCSYVDVDNDKVKDLLVGNRDIENYNSVLYYKNNGTNSVPIFNYQNDSLFQSEMIDVGEGAAPVFFDVDNDGLKDIIIGNAYKTDGTLKKPGLTYYRNTGSSKAPAFQFMTDNFASVNALGIKGPLYPAFGDLDGDGDNDMLIGIPSGELLYFTNTVVTPNSPAVFQFTTAPYMRIDAGSNATPQIYDVDKDGKPDLIVGQKEGGLIRYYRDTGTTVAYFDSIPTNDSLGKIVQRNPAYTDSYTVPFLYNDSGVTRLVVADMEGYIIRYNNIDGNLNGAYSIQDTLFQRQFGHSFNFNETVSGTDINGDGLTDFAVGIYSGGMQIYLQDNPKNVAETLRANLSFEIYPNPTDDYFTIKAFHFSDSYSVKIFNSIGELVWTKISSTPTLTVNTTTFSSGVYLVQLTSESQSAASKLFLSHK